MAGAIQYGKGWPAQLGWDASKVCEMCRREKNIMQHIWFCHLKIMSYDPDICTV
jgi:hypothetical protein